MIFLLVLHRFPVIWVPISPIAYFSWIMRLQHARASMAWQRLRAGGMHLRFLVLEADVSTYSCNLSVFIKIYHYCSVSFSCKFLSLYQAWGTWAFAGRHCQCCLQPANSLANTPMWPPQAVKITVPSHCPAYQGCFPAAPTSQQPLRLPTKVARLLLLLPPSRQFCWCESSILTAIMGSASLQNLNQFSSELSQYLYV